MLNTHTTFTNRFNFSGTWLLNRHIEQQHNTAQPSTIFANGEAVFSQLKNEECAANAWDYHETVITELAEKKFSSQQSYHYRLRDHELMVYFAHSARLFHTCSLAALYQSADPFPIFCTASEHQCANDLYQTTYIFYQPAHFRICYHVRGERKAYTMQTDYHRQA
jgi:hypothetical protein